MCFVPSFVTGVFASGAAKADRAGSAWRSLSVTAELRGAPRSLSKAWHQCWVRSELLLKQAMGEEFLLLTVLAGVDDVNVLVCVQ